MNGRRGTSKAETMAIYIHNLIGYTAAMVTWNVLKSIVANVHPRETIVNFLLYTRWMKVKLTDRATCVF